jgi:magnesium transporter
LQHNLLHSFTDERAKELVNEMAPDDRVRLLDELPAGVAKKLLDSLSLAERESTSLLMGYEPKTAGRIMTTEYISLKKYMTARQAMEKVRMQAKDKETVYTLFVTDEARILEGVLTLKELIVADDNTEIEELMSRKAVSVFTNTDQEIVAHTLKEFDLLAIPVVDKEGRIVGIITIDDVIDIIEQETTEDFSKMAAITPIEKPYNKTTVWEIVKARSPWLLVLMISATFTNMIIDSFENALVALPILMGAIPMLMDTAGNAGSQSSTTIVRAMSLNEVSLKGIFGIIWKEIRVAVICGIILAVVNMGRMLLFTNATPMTAAVVSITLILTVFIAKAIGSALPMLANRIKLDPAVVSATVVTTIADILALIVYFGMAKLLLGV